VKISRLLFRAALLLLIGLSSCTRLNVLMKAKSTHPDYGFINFRATPDKQSRRSPWHYAAFTKDRKILDLAMTRHRLYVAPVRTADLRPISTKLASMEYDGSRAEQSAQVAKTLRAEFINALCHRQKPLYRNSPKPAGDALTLELNLIELDPTSAKGNVAKTVVKYTVGPLPSMGVGLFTGGKIAIEGRIRDGRTGAIIFQFADREKDKATFYNVRDYTPLGHAERTAREWAEQLDAFLRTPPGGQLKDSFFFTPMLY
jgi:hypothetical protein